MSLHYAYFHAFRCDEDEVLDEIRWVGSTTAAFAAASAVRSLFAEWDTDGEGEPTVAEVINAALVPAYEGAGCEVLVIEAELDDAYVVVVHQP